MNESEDQTQKSESKIFDFDERKSSNAAAIPERNLPKQITRSSLQSPREFPVINLQKKKQILKTAPKPINVNMYNNKNGAQSMQSNNRLIN
jgi:hypothetical protein